MSNSAFTKTNHSVSLSLLVSLMFLQLAQSAYIQHLLSPYSSRAQTWANKDRAENSVSYQMYPVLRIRPSHSLRLSSQVQLKLTESGPFVLQNNFPTVISMLNTCKDALETMFHDLVRHNLSLSQKPGEIFATKYFLNCTPSDHLSKFYHFKGK